MKKYIRIAIALLLSLAAVNITSVNAESMDADTIPASSRYIYVGAEFGISEPIIKSFTHRHNGSNTVMRLKKSHMYGGRLGYGFYPGMMVEISASHQPRHRLAYRLPAQSLDFLVPGLSIPVTPGITRVSVNMVLANLVYEMQKATSLEVKPYAIFGIGVATVSISPTTSYWKAPEFLGLGQEVPYFKIKKSRQKCLAWQAGFGIQKELSKNFNIDLGARMQLIHNVKVKYQTLNTENNRFDEAKPIKKTIGAWEFTMGITYRLPLSI